MEDLPPLTGPQRMHLTIPNPAWLHDHRFLDQAVLPGVHALEVLARTVTQSVADAVVTSLDDVRFDKLLALPAPDKPCVDALAEITPDAGGGIAASLMTRHVAAQTGMRRLKVHARTRFATTRDGVRNRLPAPWRPTAPADGFQVPAELLYADMVPFGAAFRNVVSAVALWPEGARAVVSGGPAERAADTILGSPFPLDAAFHAACAWAQRYHGLAAFPVAMARRRVWQPTRTEAHYEAAVLFQGANGRDLCFNLQLRDREGLLCETVQGLVMRDISGGRIKPPAWIRTSYP